MPEEPQYTDYPDYSEHPHLEQHYIEHEEVSAWQRYWRKVGGGSLSFAILIHLGILIVGMFWVFSTIIEPDKKVDFLPGGGGGGGGGQRGPQYEVKKKRMATITPSSATKRVAVAGAASYALPDPGDSFGEKSSLSSLTGGVSGGLGGEGSGGGFGKGQGRGIGSGKGTGFGGGGAQMFLAGLPESLRSRCTQQERLKRLREAGGDADCDQAVIKALGWLRSKQNSDGSWGNTHKAAMTGLVLLACFGHCETPRSAEYGECVLKGMTYLINLAGSGGTMKTSGGNAWVYEHSIATYALCEALTFCKELKYEVPGLKDTCQKAVDIIVKGQNPSGFWDYGYNTTSSRPGDTSVTGWHVQALKAAHHAGLESAAINGAIDRALKKLEEVQAEDGTFGYTKREALGQRLVGVGALCFQLWNQENARPAREAVRWMNRNMEPVYASKESNLYAWYYTTLSLFQKGGTIWDKWNKKWKPEMLANQKPEGDWKVEGAFTESDSIRSTKSAGNDADIYRTCLCTLMLEAYYRFLPGTGGKGAPKGGGGDEFGL